ncbi:MAG TPA: class I SAM-dependent methyltransferase [Gammaproteobacteria bacterium]|nr:class I SAM-dependent methyltransferase [Gammaproteobacteria bacterium]
MNNPEKYDFEIGEEGLDYDLLDKSFNPSTQAFVLKSGIKPGMKVLDVGCGAGLMTAWLAKQVGQTGLVVSIDNSEAQLNVTIRRIQQEKLSNVQTRVLSAYDILQLNEKFDLIYCRFVLHHLHSPRRALNVFYEGLNTGGLYIGEEGIIGAAFAYPPTFAWQGYIPEFKNPEDEIDGMERDPDIGMKLLYLAKKAGFAITDLNLVQPVFWKKDQKMGLLKGLIAYKKTDLAHGTTEEQWQHKFNETKRLIDDDNQIIGFYGSCQIAAIKNI